MVQHVCSYQRSCGVYVTTCSHEDLCICDMHVNTCSPFPPLIHLWWVWLMDFQVDRRHFIFENGAGVLHISEKKMVGELFWKCVME